MTDAAGLEIWSARRVAFAAGAELRREARPGEQGPQRVVIDSRSLQSGDLFVGLPGERVDGGSFAAAALDAGAWGAIVAPAHAEALLGASTGAGALLAAESPLVALGELARAWRRDLAAFVVGVTGSVGKTTTKDILAAMLAPHRRVAASRANFNTEIGMPLEILRAPACTDTLVLELAMRGTGQIAELAAIAEPDVGLVTNVGPVHLEQVGDLEGVARAKGELVAALRPEGAAVIPVGEPTLAGLVAEGADTIRFGDGGDVRWLDRDALRAEVLGEPVTLSLPDTLRSEHNLSNVLAALAAAAALGVRVEGALAPELAPLHGERVALVGGAVAINDCYNANPLSMRAALAELARAPATGRRIALLGDMLELGDGEVEEHRRVGALARDSGVDLLVAVGPRMLAALDEFDDEAYAAANASEAAALLGDLLGDGDLVLIKGSRGVGLEVVAEALASDDGTA